MQLFRKFLARGRERRPAERGRTDPRESDARWIRDQNLLVEILNGRYSYYRIKPDGSIGERAFVTTGPAPEALKYFDRTLESPQLRRILDEAISEIDEVNGR